MQRKVDILTKGHVYKYFIVEEHEYLKLVRNGLKSVAGTLNKLNIMLDIMF